MKTLFPPIYLSRGLRDAFGNKHFGSDDIVLSEQLQQEGDSFMISVPVPGLSKEDLSVYVDGRVLFITKRRQAKLSDQHSGLEQEFKYSFVVPDGIDTDRIDAKCRHGLLTIKLKKAQSKKNHTVIKVLGDENRKDSGQRNTFWNKIKAKIYAPKFVERRQIKVSQSGTPGNL